MRRQLLIVIIYFFVRGDALSHEKSITSVKGELHFYLDPGIFFLLRLFAMCGVVANSS